MVLYGLFKVNIWFYMVLYGFMRIIMEQPWDRKKRDINGFSLQCHQLRGWQWDISKVNGGFVRWENRTKKGEFSGTP